MPMTSANLSRGILTTCNGNYLSRALCCSIVLFIAMSLTGCNPSEPSHSNVEVSTAEESNAFQTASGQPVTRGKVLNFPEDHGSHQEQGIEWWYITANLTAETGESFGVQWTLFRTLMPSNVESKWWDNNLYFAHFAMQHQQQHVSFERFARANQAKVIALPFLAQIDNWQLTSKRDAFLPLKLEAAQDDYHINLSLDNSPMTLHGDNGYSQKTQSGHASYYYSYPFLQVDGDVVFDGKAYKVTGNAWYDREWSASLLDKSQLGWDWFSLVNNDNKLANNDDKGLMLFCIRSKSQESAGLEDLNNVGYDNCSGTYIASNGAATPIDNAQIELAVLETIKLDNRKYPSKWQVSIDGKAPIIVETLTKDSRNKLTIPYWEGRVKASGGFNGAGYAELTGY